jgi:uncharacterized protein (TIGR02996 family)
MANRPAFPQLAATLPGEADILASVVADLSDDTAKLVYADWLQERDDPRGQFLRENLVAVRAGAKLPTPKFAPQPWLDLVGLTLLRRIHLAELDTHAGKILRLARPALTFKSAKAADSRIAVGASKLGGGPDLPPGAEWPALRKEPLAFLAQFDLAELHASFVCRELPAAGVLSVFVYFDDNDTGKMMEKGAWRVFHFPDASKLSRRLPPDNAPGSCRIEFRETMTVPDSDSPWRKELGLRKDQDVWDVYQGSVAGYGGGHQLLGYPAPIQHEVLGKKTERHLLTIGRDSNAGWEWFDGGALYFTMSETDLKAGRFDRVRFEIQCG